MSAIGKIPAAQLAALLLVIVGAAGFLGYQKYYTPAVQERDTAQTEAQTAQEALSAAQAELQRLEESGPDFGQLASAGVANVAVPAKANEGDAFLELTRMARRSGVRLLEESVSVADSGSGAGTEAPTGPRGIDLTLSGFGRFPDVMDYVDRIESTVRVEDGKAYIRGRLFSIQTLEMAPADQNESSLTPDGVPGPLEVPLDGQHYVEFTIVTRIFTRGETDATGGPGLPGEDDSSEAGAPAQPGSAPASAGSAPAPGASGTTPVGTS